MANEIQFPWTDTAKNLYALVYNDGASVWDVANTLFTSYVTSNLDDYDIVLTELGTASRYYTGTFPPSITAGIYNVVVYDRAGGAPAEGDDAVSFGTFQWDGTSLVDLSPVSNLDAAITSRSTLTQGQVGTQVNSELVTLGLDHLVSTAVTAPDVVNNSIVAKLVSKSGTANFGTYDHTSDSLEAIRDRGDSAWMQATTVDLNSNQSHVTIGILSSFALSAKNEINAEVDTALGDIGATVARMGYLDNLNIGGNVASSVEATSIQNNTRTVRVVPAIIERPDSGTQIYRLDIYLYDSSGNMEAPDFAPVISVVNHLGVSRDVNLDVTSMNFVSTGRYTANYTVADSHDLEQLIFNFAVTENSVLRNYGNTSLVVDTTAVDFTTSDRSDLQAILADTGNMQPKLGTPSVDVSADIAALKGVADNILTDTGTTGVLISGAKQTLDVLQDISTTQVNTEVQSIVVTNGLDHLVATSVLGTDIANNSIIAYMTSSSGTADWDSYVNTTDSLQAIRDNQSGVTPPSVAQIADGVWDEARADHVIPGSTGEGVVVERLNPQAKQDVNDEADTALADYDAPTNAEMTARTLVAAQYGTSANQTTMLTDLLDIKGTGFAKDTHSLPQCLTAQAVDIRAEMDSNSVVLSAILGDTNELQTDWKNDGRLDNLLDSISVDVAAVPVNVWTNGTRTLTAFGFNVDVSTTALTNIKSQMADSLTDIHLDHLLATDTDSPLPGVSGSILHDLLEDNLGVWVLMATSNLGDEVKDIHVVVQSLAGRNR